MLAIFIDTCKMSSMHTIYPSPGSFNDFCGRNPDLDPSSRIHHLANELSMWRATSPDIDMRVATLNIGEASVRQEVQSAIDRGEAVIRLVEWPSVGSYDVPVILAQSAVDA